MYKQGSNSELFAHENYALTARSQSFYVRNKRYILNIKLTKFKPLKRSRSVDICLLAF